MLFSLILFWVWIYENSVDDHAGVTSYSVDFTTKKVTIIGDLTPFDVLASVSKVKYAQFWPSPNSSSSSTPQSSSSSLSSTFWSMKIKYFATNIPFGVCLYHAEMLQNSWVFFFPSFFFWCKSCCFCEEVVVIVLLHFPVV